MHLFFLCRVSFLLKYQTVEGALKVLKTLCEAPYSVVQRLAPAAVALWAGEVLDGEYDAQPGWSVVH